MLAIEKIDATEPRQVLSLPAHLRPVYSSHWDIYAMVGPYDEGYIVAEDIDMIYDTVWYVLTSQSDPTHIRNIKNHFPTGRCPIMLPEVAFVLSGPRQDSPEKTAAKVASTPVM